LDSAVCANRSSACNVLLDVPSGCQTSKVHPKTRCPVVFCFHGFGGSSNEMCDQCSSLLHENSMIGIYPQGDSAGTRNGHPVPGWNDGQEVENIWRLKCPWNDTIGPPWCQKDMNDLNFTSRIVRSIAARGAAGHKYSYGVSNGADHSQRIAASAVVAYDALPFSAIAANSAQLMATPARAGPGPYNWNSLNSGRPVAQLAFHGTNDSTIAYEGGPKFGNTTFILMSEPESNKAWAVHNGCKSTISNTTVTAVIKGGALSTAIHHSFEECPSEAPVEWYEVKGGAHGAAADLNGKPLFQAAISFFQKVERALEQWQ